MGIFKNQKLILIIFPAIALIGCSYYFYQSTQILSEVSLILFLSGTAGNFIDRLFRKDGVIDMIGISELPLFNFADFYLLIGFIGLFIDTLVY